MSEGKLDGFRLGEYFIAFPPGDFVKEDENGTYIIVDIYKVNREDGGYKRVERSQLPADLEEQINEELNRMLLEALNLTEENYGQDNSKED